MATQAEPKTAHNEDDHQGPKTATQGAALWFVGLPGSGKSSLARAVMAELKTLGLQTVHLEMDARRKAYFPTPTYSARERAEAYRLFVEEAADLVRQGTIVLMDGSAHKRAMRDAARRRIRRFAEVFVRCPLATAMRREAARPEGKVMAGLYAKAVKRKATGEQFEGLGEVIGVDVPFEEDAKAEVVVDAETLSPEEAARRVLKFLRPWLSA